MSKTALKKRPSVLKTTVIINENVMKKVKQLAAKQGCTISLLVESGLRLVLDQDKKPQKIELSPLPSWNMGKPLVDISNRDALYDAMESE